jgi:hypothetical protein
MDGGGKGSKTRNGCASLVRLKTPLYASDRSSLHLTAVFIMIGGSRNRTAFGVRRWKSGVHSEIDRIRVILWNIVLLNSYLVTSLPNVGYHWFYTINFHGKKSWHGWLYGPFGPRLLCNFLQSTNHYENCCSISERETQAIILHRQKKTKMN